jgi:hypothetical protein
MLIEEDPKLFDELFEKATDYGKTSYELIKLKTLDKTADVGSSLILHSIILIFLTSFLLFVNLGLAFWLGEILGKIYWGFFIMAGFYCLVGIVVHLLSPGWLKKALTDYLVKQLFK